MTDIVNDTDNFILLEPGESIKADVSIEQRRVMTARRKVINIEALR